MSGVLCTAWLFFNWAPWMKWASAAGLLLALLGLSAQVAGHPLTDDAKVLPFVGLWCCLLPAATMGGLYFRNVSASRAVLLIPRGRLQLYLGSLLAHMLMATVVVLVGGMSVVLEGRAAGVATSPAQAFEVFLGAFGFLSILFLGMFLGTRGAWIMLFPFIPPAASAYLPHLGSWLAGTWLARHLDPWTAWSIAVAACWAWFGFWYVHARRIESWRPARLRETLLRHFLLDRSSAWSNGVNGFVHDPATRAVRTLLLGPQPYALTAQSILFICFSILFLGMASGLPALGGNVPGASFRISLLFLAAPFAAAGLMAAGVRNRSRGLWLREGFARTKLYRLAERYAWEPFLVMAVILGGISLLVQADWPVSHATGARALLTQFVSGVSFLYLALFLAQRWCATNIAATIVVTALWLSGLVLAWNEASWSTIALYVALQVGAAAVLRWQGQRVWRRIDWMTNKPVRLPAGTGAAAR